MTIVNLHFLEFYVNGTRQYGLFFWEESPDSLLLKVFFLTFTHCVCGPCHGLVASAYVAKPSCQPCLTLFFKKKQTFIWCAHAVFRVYEDQRVVCACPGCPGG